MCRSKETNLENSTNLENAMDVSSEPISDLGQTAADQLSPIFHSPLNATNPMRFGALREKLKLSG